jgi:uncharacterized protein YebE (UPF0316 family)
MFYICIKIFFARIVDVSIGTIRTVLTVKGRKTVTTILAFFEVFIWFIVAREALNTEFSSIIVPIFYALGYATGTLLGIIITQTFMKGFVGMQVITNSDNQKLIKRLRDEGYGVSVCPLIKNTGKKRKELLLIQFRNKRLQEVNRIIKDYDQNAFITLTETKYLQNGVVK